MRFDDKVVLITGASRGIGRATALAFAGEGAKVVANYYVSDYEPEALQNAQILMDDIGRMGRESMMLEADVRSESAVQAMLAEAHTRYGKIDILVNNAGIVYDLPIADRSLQQWNQTINTNLYGTYICSKLVSKYMEEVGSGKIVNISSTNAINAFNPESIDYDASKAGIITLTKIFAKELAPQIQVNAVAPGWVNTEMNQDLPSDFVKAETDKIYTRRFAEPEEIARAILFLASDDANYINGSVLVIDGGHD